MTHQIQVTLAPAGVNTFPQRPHRPPPPRPLRPSRSPLSTCGPGDGQFCPPLHHQCSRRHSRASLCPVTPPCPPAPAQRGPGTPAPQQAHFPCVSPFPARDRCPGDWPAIRTPQAWSSRPARASRSPASPQPSPPAPLPRVCLPDPISSGFGQEDAGHSWVGGRCHKQALAP